MKINFSIVFIILGLLALLFGALIGVLISVSYLDASFMKDIIPFNQLRPMHTTTVVSWIILSATGGVYYYVSKVDGVILFSKKMGILHLSIFMVTGIFIYYSFLSGNMGGREYLEYLPILTIPILLGWILFGFNFFKTLAGKVKNRPVYMWMWGTGIVFMIYHLSEAHFWIFSDIRSDFIKDMSVQWKSYGSFVGSWNMLVYGTAIYLMGKIKKDDTIGRGKTAFFFYFLGMTNLMFGWAHHTYILPNAAWIRYVAYIISMTEWIIFIHIVYSWAKSLSKKTKKENLLAYRFLMASEFWVFANLVLALFMSIPALNYYMHGTHITVGHSMGTTIGINTSILLASVAFIVKKRGGAKMQESKSAKLGFMVMQFSLLVFWLSLIAGGIFKAIWTADIANTAFSQLQTESHSYYLVFVISGCLLFISLCMIAIPFIQRLLVKPVNEFTSL